MLDALSRMRTGGPYALASFGKRYHSMVAEATHSQSAAPVISEAARDLPEGASVLEVGAGTGLSAVTLARQRPDLEVTATDLNEAMLAAGQAAQDAPPNVTWMVADACALPFADASFDLAVSFNAFKHFPDKRLGVAELVRVVRPGGAVIVCEVAPWVPWRTTWTVVRRLKMLALLKPFFAFMLRRETRALLGRRENLDGWFADHVGAGPATISAMTHPELGDVPFWRADLRREQ